MKGSKRERPDVNSQHVSREIALELERRVLFAP